MRPSPQPSNWLNGSARFMGTVSEGSPSGAYGHGHAVDSIPWNWMLPMRLLSSWCVWPWMTVTFSYGLRMACTSSASSVQKFQGL